MKRYLDYTLVLKQKTSYTYIKRQSGEVTLNQTQISPIWDR